MAADRWAEILGARLRCLRWVAHRRAGLLRRAGRMLVPVELRAVRVVPVAVNAALVAVVRWPRLRVTFLLTKRPKCGTRSRRLWAARALSSWRVKSDRK